ncbi:MAG: hypothetical protein OQK12_14645 [Motiliproteus sp.]|nr:hypothetical protein [Motiliproteus sp.]MCW9052043.1 hypothetical protein [Motiliproteus sp.]
MNSYLSAQQKSEYQRNYRNFEDHYTKGEAALQALKQAKASRIWIVGVIALFFSMHSEFYLGMAAALLGAYFYQIISAYMKKAQVEDSLEEIERWFSTKGLVFQDKTAFFKEDDQLENPIDLFQDTVYQ